MCIILKKEVPSSVQHPTNAQAGSITAAVGHTAQWSPVVQRIGLPNAASVSSDWESYQLSCVKGLEFLAHIKQLYGSPSEPLMNSRCTLTRRNWILVHNKSASCGLEFKDHCSLSSPQNILAWNTVIQLHKQNPNQSPTQELQTSLQFSRDLSDALIATKKKKKSHIWKI